MKFLLKTLSILVVWGAVVYLIVYVDPETVKDVGIEGLYLPFLSTTIFAVWYTIITLYRSFLLALIISALVGLAMALSVMHYMSWFTGIVIILIIFFTLYLHRRNSLDKESGKGVESK